MRAPAVQVANFESVKNQRVTFVECKTCGVTFKAGHFRDGSLPDACPTCRVGVDPAGQSVTIDTESRF